MWRYDKTREQLRRPQEPPPLCGPPPYPARDHVQGQAGTCSCPSLPSSWNLAPQGPQASVGSRFTAGLSLVHTHWHTNADTNPTPPLPHDHTHPHPHTTQHAGPDHAARQSRASLGVCSPGTRMCSPCCNPCGLECHPRASTGSSHSPYGCHPAGLVHSQGGSCGCKGSFLRINQLECP